MITRHTGKRLTSYQVKRLTQEKLSLYFKDAATLFTASHTLQLMQQLKIQVEEIEDFVLSYCKQNTPFSIITSTPGIGKILGMTILLETGPIERFAQVRNYSSYARCVPTNKISNGKSKGSIEDIDAPLFNRSEGYHPRWIPRSGKVSTPPN